MNSSSQELSTQIPKDNKQEVTESQKPEYLGPSQLLEMTVPQGKYQYKLLLYFCTVGFLMASINYMLPFVFYSPKFACKDSDGSTTLCTEEDACASALGFVTVSDKYSVVDHFQLYCENHGLAIWGKSFIFTFSSLITMFIVILSDYWGRVMIFYASWLASILGILICNFSQTYYFMIIGLGLLKASCYSFMSGVYVYSNEITCGKMQNSFNGFMFISAATGGVLFNFANIWIFDFYTIIYIQSITLGLWGIGCWALVESPHFLYKEKNFEQLKTTLLYLLNFNMDDEKENLKDKQIELSYEISRLSNNMRKLPPSDIETSLSIMQKISTMPSRLEKLRIYMKIACITLIVANLYISDGILTLIPQEMGIDNIYLNGALLSFSEMAGYLSLVFVAHKIKRRLLNIIICLSIITISLVAFLIAMLDARTTITGKLMESSLSIFLKLAICMNFVLVFNYTAELFDMNQKGLALGLAIFAGRTAMGAGSLLIEWAHSYDVHPVSASMFGTLLVLPLAMYLPETRNNLIH